MSFDFSFNPIQRLFAERAEASRSSKSKLADQGPLGSHRTLAKSLSKPLEPSHPGAGRLIAQSSPGDMSGLYSTNGPADQFRRAIVQGTNRA